MQLAGQLHTRMLKIFWGIGQRIGNQLINDRRPITQRQRNRGASLQLLTTLAVLDHMRLGGWVGYEIAHLNQYGPATIDLGPNWPFPTGRVSTGYVDADVVTQGWVLGISLGYGW